MGSYSFHTIVTSDGWCIGTGGADNPGVNSAIEKLAGSMVQANYISLAKIKKIMGYIRYLGGIGHFAIKAPSGFYYAAWKNSYHYGKLKPGQYISVPNSRAYFREGSFAKWGKVPSQIGVKIGASDGYGVNRRDITVHHWKAITTYGSTVAHIASYAANDNGKLVGLSTAYLKDNVYYKGKFYSKNSLPQATNAKYLGYHDFGSINYLKIQSNSKAPVLTTSKAKPQDFKVTVKYKSNNKPVKGFYVKINVFTGNKFKIYVVKTDSYGVARLKTGALSVGSHKVYVYSSNRYLLISVKSWIRITN